jgi:hypothetical protein
MDGEDVVRDVEEMRPRVEPEPFLGDGEQLQVVLRASERVGKGPKVAAAAVWPFRRESGRYLLVASDYRWQVLESSRERFRGRLQVRAQCDRAIVVATSWIERFEGFDRPYAIDPIYELWARAANDALAARESGRGWSLAGWASSLG